ncbi:hypothetical protein PENTCL1PPCAC_1706, partial [Pristionchus entomophagus]
PLHSFFAFYRSRTRFSQYYLFFYISEMSFLPAMSNVVDVNEWMMKCDHLVKLIENIVANNPADVMTQSTMDPQFNEEAVKGVVELGYRDVRHFCQSFPDKFQVHDQSSIVSLRNTTIPHQTNRAMNWNAPSMEQSKGNYATKAEKLRDSIKLAVAYNRVDGTRQIPHGLMVNPDRNNDLVNAARELGFRSVRDFCESCPDHFTVHPTGVITTRERAPEPFPALSGQTFYIDPKTGAWLKDTTPARMTDHTQAMKEFQAMNISDNSKAPVKMEEKIHFKITHAGATRRFALTCGEEDLLSALKARVLKITGTDDVSLFWKDEDSLIILESVEDLNAAVDYAETQNKLACVVLETGVDKKEEAKADAKVVTAEESMAAFNGFSFLCDACDCHLAPSNGGRFKCTLCDNYDLCAACLAKGDHDNHAFVRILNGETEIPLWNEVGGVLSTIAKDIPRCSPTFVVKSGDRLKGADKIFIDVIDSVGKHVGKKMYDTAQWMKKEAEKMSARREEAEVEEQKMVEEIIRRERDEERKRHRQTMQDEFNAQREEILKKRREEQSSEEHHMKDAETAAEELKAKLEQTVRDRRMAEQMWREEKNRWKGTRKQFKREEKQLRKSEKVISKSQKEAARHQDRLEKKPEEKRQEEQKEDKLQYSRDEMMSLKEPTVNDFLNAPGNAFAALKEQQREAADADTSDSSDDSDVELLDKPTSEKNDSISSDLIMLDDQKDEPTAAAPAAEKEAAAPNAAPAEQQEQQPQQPRQRSMYPELPPQTPYNPYDRQPWGPSHKDASGWGAYDRREDRGFGGRDEYRGRDEPAFVRGGPTRASEPFRRGDDRRDGGAGWGSSSRWTDSRRDGDRDVRERGAFGFAGRRVDSDLERQASQSRAERESRWRQAERPKEKNESESYARAARIPAFMEIAVLTELKNQGPEIVRCKLAEYISHLQNNTYSRERHNTVLVDDQRFDNELIRTVAGNLMKRLLSMEKIVQYATALDCPRMLENRIHELTNGLKSEEHPIDDEKVAAQLRDILLTSKYTSPRYGFNAFGGIPPLENFGQGLNSFMDQSRASLSNYLSGFMPMGPPRGAFDPRTARPAAAASAARDAADAAASHAADAAAAGSSAAGAAAASAPAEEKPDTTPLTDDQQKVLRELFATGMFDDYDKMIKVCRRATDLHEAIDMMLD